MTIPTVCGIAIFSVLAFYFFCVKVAILGLLLGIIVVGMIERGTRTIYVFHKVKPIDLDEELDFLTIDAGRFSRKKHIAVRDIKQVTRMNAAFGIDHYVLIEFGEGNLESVQPADEARFLEELKKRQHEID